MCTIVEICKRYFKKHVVEQNTLPWNVKATVSFASFTAPVKIISHGIVITKTM